MTKYEVEIILEPPKGNAENAVHNWVANHNEWTDDGQDHVMHEHDDGEPDYDGAAYVHAVYRFHQDSAADITAVVDDLQDRLDSLQGGLWYKIGAHDGCTHDLDSGRMSCEHTIVRHGGDPPDSVPNLNR